MAVLHAYVVFRSMTATSRILRLLGQVLKLHTQVTQMQNKERPCYSRVESCEHLCIYDLLPYTVRSHIVISLQSKKNNCKEERHTVVWSLSVLFKTTCGLNAEHRRTSVNSMQNDDSKCLQAHCYLLTRTLPMPTFARLCVPTSIKNSVFLVNCP